MILYYIFHKFQMKKEKNIIFILIQMKGLIVMGEILGISFL